MRSLLGLLLLTGSLGGCLSGQTGSPDCVPGKACVCDPMYGAGTQLRVHVESLREGQLRAVVDEVFMSMYGTNGLSPGDHIGGFVSAAQPCAADAPLEAAEGSELFVLFTPGQNGDYPRCAQLQSCAASQCAGLGEPASTDCWSDCEEQARSSCDSARQTALLDGSYGWAIPWSDPLSFGEGRELPRSELSVLAGSSECLERFPADPAPPCNDTQSLTCAAAPRRPLRTGYGSWAVAVGASLLVAYRARRRRG